MILNKIQSHLNLINVGNIDINVLTLYDPSVLYYPIVFFVLWRQLVFITDLEHIKKVVY